MKFVSQNEHGMAAWTIHWWLRAVERYI